MFHHIFRGIEIFKGIYGRGYCVKSKCEMLKFTIKRLTLYVYGISLADGRGDAIARYAEVSAHFLAQNARQLEQFALVFRQVCNG